MVVKTTTQVGNPLIRARAKRVQNLKSASAQRVINDLTDSMRHHNLVGMAANQIGKDTRVFVSEVRKTKLRNSKILDPLRIFVNPRIISLGKKKVRDWEGCGSIASASLFGMVERPENLVIQAFDKHGKKFELKANGLLARIIQHEMDHLNGIVFTDKADISTLMSRSEYLKMRAKKK